MVDSPPDPFVHRIELIPVPELDEYFPLRLGQRQKVHPSYLVDGELCGVSSERGTGGGLTWYRA